MNKEPRQELDELLIKICRAAWTTPEDVKSDRRDRHLAYTRHAFGIIASERFPFAYDDLLANAIGRKRAIMSYIREQAGMPQKMKFVERIKKELGL